VASNIAPTPSASAALPSAAPGQNWTNIPGWSFHSSGAMSARFDSTEHRSGSGSARIESLNGSISDDAWLSQTSLDVTPYKGKRLRLRGFAKSSNVTRWASFWVHLIRKGRKSSIFVDQDDRVITGSSDWQQYLIVTDVPLDIDHLDIGWMQFGPGTTWIDDIRIDPVDATVPVTVSFDLPRNFDFESSQLRLPGWQKFGDLEDVTVMPDLAVFHGGKTSASIQASKATREGKFTLSQSINAKAYVGKRLRVAAYVKTEGLIVGGTFWADALPEDSPNDRNGPGSDRTRLAPTSDWRRYDCYVDVAKGSATLDVGISIQGSGQLWLDDVSLEVVPSLVSRPAGGLPRNLDLELRP